jgi:hypothetical protein
MNAHELQYYLWNFTTPDGNVWSHQNLLDVKGLPRRWQFLFPKDLEDNLETKELALACFRHASGGVRVVRLSRWLSDGNLVVQDVLCVK